MPERRNLQKNGFGQCPNGKIQKSGLRGNARMVKFKKMGVRANARIEILEISGFGQMPARQNSKKLGLGKRPKVKFEKVVVGFYPKEKPVVESRANLYTALYERD